MIQVLKNYKIYCISIILLFLLCVYLMLNQTESKKIFLYDLRSNTDDIYVIFEFKTNNKIYKRKITARTKKIRLPKGSELFSVEHDNLFSTKVVLNNSNFDIYIFPNEFVREINNAYLVKEAQDVYAYFIEYYDFIKKSNYYIFSKDNVIEKLPLINDDNTSLDKLYKLQDEDLLIYNEDTQVLSSPYAGYVIKDRDNNLILLSTLWDSNLIY